MKVEGKAEGKVEGKAEGKAEGMAEGIAEGEARGLRAMRGSVLRILDRCLEAVPASIRRKLDGIRDLERLEEIHDQALTVRSVDQLVFEPESSD